MRDWLAEGADPDDDTMTPEHAEEAAQEWASWEHVHSLWLQHGKKCNCGRCISLDDAFYFGVCDACRNAQRQQVPFCLPPPCLVERGKWWKWTAMTL